MAAGSDDFENMVGPFRGELHAHCYRMLGSVHDADDALQEALVRAWKAFDGFDGAAPRAWLYRIATNVCLTAIEKRRRRAHPMDDAALEHHGVEPYPGQQMAWADTLAAEDHVVARESVELAFVVALQHLGARQRAILLLRDVLGFSAAETAAALTTSVAAVNSGVQRARRSVSERSPRRSQQQTLASLPPGAARELAGRYAAAWESGDIDGLVALLTDDVTYSMPPLAERHQGRPAVRALLEELAVPGLWRFVSTTANEQLAFGTYRWDATRGAHVAAAIDVLTVRDRQVVEVMSFLGGDSFTGFDLPPELR